MGDALTIRTHWQTSETGEPELVQETMTEPNFEQRITEAETRFIQEAQSLRPCRELAIAITHINTAAAILRDYARRPEGE